MGMNAACPLTFTYEAGVCSSTCRASSRPPRSAKLASTAPYTGTSFGVGGRGGASDTFALAPRSLIDPFHQTSAVPSACVSKPRFSYFSMAMISKTVSGRIPKIRA